MAAALWAFVSPVVSRVAVPLAFAAGLVAALVLAALWDRFIDDPTVERAARQGYVLQVEKRAAEAELAETRRQLAVATAARDRYQLGLAQAQRAAAEHAEQLESEIADYERKLDAAGRACRLDGADLEWLRKR